MRGSDPIPLVVFLDLTPIFIIFIAPGPHLLLLSILSLKAPFSLPSVEPGVIPSVLYRFPPLGVGVTSPSALLSLLCLPLGLPVS